MKNGHALKAKSPPAKISRKIRRSYLKHVKDKERFPLGGYAVLMAAYVSIYAGLYRSAVRAGKKIPCSPSFRDLALLGIATHKISRIVTKSLIASPLRSPFTEYGEPMGTAEIYEKSRGKGLLNAFGDLITCPWCFGSWAAMGSCFGLALAPRLTRMTASVLTVAAISDYLHVIYDILKKLKK